jgi:hypothetical protein
MVISEQWTAQTDLLTVNQLRPLDRRVNQQSRVTKPGPWSTG